MFGGKFLLVNTILLIEFARMIYELCTSQAVSMGVRGKDPVLVMLE